MLEIVEIKWERTNIILKLNNKIDNNCYLINKNNEKFKLETNNTIIKIPITNIPEGSMIEEGKWTICLNNEIIKINEDIVELLDDKSRVFKYRDGFYTLCVTFEIDEYYNLYIDTNYMMKNKKYKKFNRICEGENLKKKIILLLKIILIKIVNIIYIILSSLSSKNKILLLTENSDELQGNLKETHNILKHRKNVIIYCKDIYKRNSLIKVNFKELLYIAKSKYIIVDNYSSLLTILNLKTYQKIIQLWHAGVGFKAVGYARFGKPGSPHPFISSHRKYNYAIVDREELVDIYQEVFGCKKEIFMPCTMPRLNNYLDKEKIKEVTNNIFEKNKILKNKKIILFSPTYRGTGSKGAYYDYSKLDLNKISSFCQENNFIFVIKMHPFIKDKIKINKEYTQYILDLSDYEINDLIYITDIMITDYSSCAYEYSFFNRPLIFYRYDKTLYEYLRPIHTLDLFVKEQYEVCNIEDLIKILNKLRNVNIKNRFENIKKNQNNTNLYDIMNKKIFKE